MALDASHASKREIPIKSTVKSASCTLSVDTVASTGVSMALTNKTISCSFAGMMQT